MSTAPSLSAPAGLLVAARTDPPPSGLAAGAAHPCAVHSGGVIVPSCREDSLAEHRVLAHRGGESRLAQ